MLSTALEVIGFACLVAGCSLLALWLALIVGGVGLMAIGYALDLNPPKT